MPTTLRHRSARAAASTALAAALVATGIGCGSDAEQDSADTSEVAPSVSVAGIATRNLDAEQGLQPSDGGSVVFGLEAETDGWNPVANRWAGSGHYVASALFDPLATIDADGAVVPYLATSIEPGPDATTWTIVLRDGVTFHDGAPLSAEDVKASLDAHTTSILTAKAVAAIESTEAVGPLTVKVTMSEPWTSFPYTLTTQIGYVIPATSTTDLASAERPVGTGPFEFETWTKGSRLVVNKNPDYWQDGKPHLEQIEFRPITDTQQRFDALQDGELDLMHTIAVPDIVALRDSPYKMVEVSNGEEAFLSLNTQQAPFDRREARLAVAHATDIDRFLAETGRIEAASPARGAFAPGQSGYRDDNGYPAYDLDTAREYARQYQEATGEPLEFVYKGAVYLDAQRAQQSLVAMWEEAGITVTVETLPQEQQILDAALGNYQMIDFRNFGALDSDGEVVWWHSRSVGEPGGVSLNFPRFGDSQIDEALMEARSTDDPAVRDEAYARVNRRLNEEAPYIWLERVTWALAASPHVNGIGAAANGTVATLGAKTWLADLWVGELDG